MPPEADAAWTTAESRPYKRTAHTKPFPMRRTKRMPPYRAAHRDRMRSEYQTIPPLMRSRKQDASEAGAKAHPESAEYDRTVTVPPPAGKQHPMPGTAIRRRQTEAVWETDSHMHADPLRLRAEMRLYTVFPMLETEHRTPKAKAAESILSTFKNSFVGDFFSSLPETSFLGAGAAVSLKEALSVKGLTLRRRIFGSSSSRVEIVPLMTTASFSTNSAPKVARDLAKTITSISPVASALFTAPARRQSGYRQ